MRFNCKKFGCRKACFSREELREHMRTTHRPTTAPVLEAKPSPEILFATTPGKISVIPAGPFVIANTDKGLSITHVSGDTALIAWSLIRK